VLSVGAERGLHRCREVVVVGGECIVGGTVLVGGGGVVGWGGAGVGVVGLCQGGGWRG